GPRWTDLSTVDEGATEPVALPLPSRAAVRHDGRARSPVLVVSEGRPRSGRPPPRPSALPKQLVPRILARPSTGALPHDERLLPGDDPAVATVDRDQAERRARAPGCDDRRRPAGPSAGAARSQPRGARSIAGRGCV